MPAFSALLLAATLAAGAPPSPVPVTPPATSAAVPDFAPPRHDWTIYHVMMGEFRSGSRDNDGEIRGWKHPNYIGGDLQGVLQSVDHIAALGCDAVWLSPIFASRTSHGYDVTNYWRVADQVAVPGDPVASEKLFHDVVDAFHAKGVKVILDIPLNHASRSYDRKLGDPEKLSPRATAARQEAEKLWDSWGGDYRYWDFDDAPTRKFLIDAALHWLVDENVDGLRLDYVRGVPHDFWADLRAAVDAKKPGAYLVGEAWQDAGGAEGNAQDIATYYAPVAGRPQLPSLLDFPLQMAMTDAFARNGSLADVEAMLRETAKLYGPDAEPTYFLDNHDLTRFASWTDDRDRLVAAVSFMGSLTGSVVIFYGTETGLANGAPKTGFTDAGRIAMPWGKLDEALVARVRAALQARRAHVALRRGARVPLLADRDGLVMAKVAPGETALVAVNLGSAPRRFTIDPTRIGDGAGAAAFTAVLGPSAPAASGAPDAILTWEVPPRTTAIAVRAVAPAPPNPSATGGSR